MQSMSFIRERTSTMPTVTHKGNPIEIAGNLPATGSKAPRFTLTNTALQDVGLKDFKRKKKILNINPSLDTGICAMSAKKFNEAVADMKDVVVLNISRDLPFAAKRFCETNNINNVIALCEMRDRKFGKKYGIEIKSGALAGLLARAIVVLDKGNRVVYTQLVPEIAQEPDYDAALNAVKNA